MEDIFDYAAKCVANKSVLARIGHSAKLHSVRSAFSSKGSAGSKFGSLVGAGVRATLNAIPIPVIGSLISSLEQKVENVIKSKLHGRRLRQATSKKDRVKFTLKELSVEELDRFRWKVSEAITSANKVLPGFNASLDKKRAEGATCDAYLDVALAVEQVTRRIDKIREACAGIFAALKMTLDWVDECEKGAGAAPGTMITSGASASPANGGVNKLQNDLRVLIANRVQAELDAVDVLTTTAEKDEYIAKFHGKCDKWCCFRAQGEVDNWANCKKNAAWLVRNLADPIVPDSFNNNLGQLWKTD